MKTILVVDDMPSIRDPIAAMLGPAGYRARSAGDGADALKLLRANGADLIILDVMMPGMDGLTFLRHVRSDPATAKIPVIMLSGEEDRQQIVQAGQLGIQGDISKSNLLLQEVLRRVRSQLGNEQSSAATDARLPDPILTRGACMQRAHHVLHGKSFSGVIAEAISMAESPRTSVGTLATLVGRDGLLTARILQLANSAAYRTAHPAVTVADAVRQIGCSGVRNVAISIGVYDAMPASAADGFNPLLCWRHSFAVATLCERLAAAGNAAALSGQAYLVGLCHDLGEVFFRMQFGAEYQQVLDAQARTGKPRQDIERALLGIRHGELVVAILKQLGLPDAVRHPIEVFHHGGPAHGSDAARLLSLLRLAERGANGALLAAAGDADVAPISVAEFLSATGANTAPSIDWDAFRDEILTTTSSLARLSGDDEAKLMVPLYPSSAVRVWVARDPALSSFDPVTAALQAMAEELMVHPALPSPEELGECDAVVILADNASVAGFTRRDVDRLRSASSNPPHILWLVGHGTYLKTPMGPGPSLWPITLRQLGEFVASSVRISDPAATAICAAAV